MASAPKELSERDIPACGCADPGVAGASTCYCGVEDLLRVIRRRYSLAVMNAINVRGRARHQEIAAALPAMSSSTLAETLHALEVAQLMDKQVTTTDRAVATYGLTESGTKLLGRLRQLLSEVNEG